MRLVFVGDIGVESPVPDPAPAHEAFGRADLVCANLEGAVIPADRLGTLRRRRYVALHNDPSVLEVLRHYRVGAASLANNHILDYAYPPARTRETLAGAGVVPFGAGDDAAVAAAPAIVDTSAGRVVLAGFGWPPIGCPPAGRGAGVQALTPRAALDAARALRQLHPGAALVFFMHWGYELDPWPQPAHRALAHALIRAGVDAVVGCHAHVAQGVEQVDGKSIAYGLGNWVFPPRTVRDFRVAYPQRARLQLALEVQLTGGRVADVLLHWHDFDPLGGAPVHRVTEEVDGAVASGLSPFRGMSGAEYAAWYRLHGGRPGLPVYADPAHEVRNALRDRWLGLRSAAGEGLARLGLKAEQRSARSSESR